MNSEIELKFLANELCMTQLQPILSEFSILQHEVRHLRSVYFDTKNRQLRRWRMGLRIRSGDDENVQTIKTAGRVVGGLNDRPEYNQVIQGQRPQLGRFEQLKWPENIDLQALEEALIPIFVTDFERTTWLIDLDNETLVEVALDRGSLMADEQQQPIHELELELVKGDVGQLFALAERLCALDCLTLASTSKAKRGYALADGLPPDHVLKLGLVPLDRQDDLKQAFVKSVEYALAHWQRHQQIYIDSHQLNALAQIKDAARLMHQVLTTYRQVISYECLWHTELLWLVRQLGWLDEADHLHGLLDEQGKFIRKLNNRRAIVKQLEKRQAELPAYDAIAHLLSSERYNKLLLAMIQWVYQGPELHVQREIYLRDFAVRELQQSWQELRTSELGQSTLTYQQYTHLSGHLRRNLMVGIYFGSLFDSPARDEFRLLWLDLLSGIEDLRLLEPIAELFETDEVPTDDTKQVTKWLKRKKSSIIEAMEFTRHEALAKDDYWHD